MPLTLTFNSRCKKLGHTFSSPKYYGRNFLYIRHCKRCSATLTGYVKILGPEQIIVNVELDGLGILETGIVQGIERTSQTSVESAESQVNHVDDVENHGQTA